MNIKNKFISGADPICPVDFLERARLGNSPRVAIARAGAPLPMRAALEATNEGIMVPIFVGEVDDILLEANELSWDISNYKIIDTNGEIDDCHTTSCSACERGLHFALLRFALRFASLCNRVSESRVVIMA